MTEVKAAAVAVVMAEMATVMEAEMASAMMAVETVSAMMTMIAHLGQAGGGAGDLG
ncbi:hypothetical protein [Methylobacterium sp.]|jgi:hypothetical protein|uniref:hypothetical protein n=1 Tax=Methylobacterium sp. TaxID=409 RepID=UPI002626257E|nr:hypothetical protein [Methylobacterium sp.]